MLLCIFLIIGLFCYELSVKPRLSETNKKREIGERENTVIIKNSQMRQVEKELIILLEEKYKEQ